MRVILFGASGGSGLAIRQTLLDRGHRVTAVVRSATAFPSHPAARVVQCDVLSAPNLAEVVAGHDAVVIALGIREPALAVRLRGARATANDVRSRGTQRILQAMEKAGVSRVIVQTTFGVGVTRTALPLAWRAVFRLLLAPQIRDTEIQEAFVRASTRAWTLVRPVGLSDQPSDAAVCSATVTPTAWQVPRCGVARIIADVALPDPGTVGASLAVWAER
jgi:NAD(P)-dependent dehydrogenase (short-subunit alcohol dehydrogenase family)